MTSTPSILTIVSLCFTVILLFFTWNYYTLYKSEVAECDEETATPIPVTGNDAIDTLNAMEGHFNASLCYANEQDLSIKYLTSGVSVITLILLTALSWRIDHLRRRA